MSEEAAPSAPIASALPPESGLVYRTVTQHWPKIAAGLVAAVGVAEWLIQGLTANSSLQFYVFAWASTTGGVWFLFEKAEKALPAEGRATVAGWLSTADFRGSIESIAGQFALLFDRVFGARHWTMKCFLRSCVASVISVAACYAALQPLGPRSSGGMTADSASGFVTIVFLFAALFNVIPDFISLLETRWLLGIAQRGVPLRWILVADAVMTLAVFIVANLAVFTFLAAFVFGGTGYESDDPVGTVLVRSAYLLGSTSGDPKLLIAVLASTFFTSLWLWIYAASVLVSRFLVKIGGGVGFLLKVTDVEHQPFRSMGFTAVVLTSLLFLAGLPLVLLG